MGIGDALQQLGRYLDECEDCERVRRVGLAGHGDGRAAGLGAQIEVAVAMGDGGDAGSSPGEATLALADAGVDADGRVQLSLESATGALPAPGPDVTLDPTGVSVDADGTATVVLAASIATGDPSSEAGDGRQDECLVADEGGDQTDTATGDQTDTATSDPTDSPTGDPTGDESATRSDPPRTDSTSTRDVPPFEDPELLARVYESCDTFAEMPAALGMDVTAETVRRYMIDFGIHEPASYDTGQGDERDVGPDAAAETDVEAGVEADVEEAHDPPEADHPAGEPVALTDGIGLPDDVTVDTIVDTVRRSNTIYEVERDIGIERERARDMLRELNLLDLVVGRLATEAERDLDREEVLSRLRESAAAQ